VAAVARSGGSAGGRADDPGGRVHRRSFLAARWRPATVYGDGKAELLIGAPGRDLVLVARATDTSAGAPHDAATFDGVLGCSGLALSAAR